MRLVMITAIFELQSEIDDQIIVRCAPSFLSKGEEIIYNGKKEDRITHTDVFVNAMVIMLNVQHFFNIREDKARYYMA